MARILYLHGSGHTPESFGFQAAAFPGSEPLAMPGHPAGEALRSVDEMAGWLAAEIPVRADRPAVICGNSLGAAVGLQTALSYPEHVAGLILIGCGARLRVAPQIFDMIDHRWPDSIGDLVDLSVDAACPQRLRERIRAMHLAVGPRTTHADYAACNSFDVMNRVGGIAAPTLVIVGSNDRMTPPKYANFLQEAIVESELVVVEGAGHMPHFEKPDLVNAPIRAFVETRV